MSVIIKAQTSEKSLDVLLEPSKRSIEIEKALHRANQVFVPDRAESLQGKVEEKALGHGWARLKNGLLQKGAEKFATVYFKITIDEYAVNIVVQIERVPALQQTLELCCEEFLQFVASNRRVALSVVGIRMNEKPVLNWQEYAVVLSHVQMHADRCRVRISVEVLEV